MESRRNKKPIKDRPPRVAKKSLKSLAAKEGGILCYEPAASLGEVGGGERISIRSCCKLL
jgi:hypothetical protein